MSSTQKQELVQFLLENGFTINGAHDTITITNAGIYNIQFSCQLNISTNNTVTFNIWLNQNSANVDWTNTAVFLLKDDPVVAAWNFLTQADAGDTIQLIWWASNDNAFIQAAPAATGPIRPAIPSIILTIQEV